MFPVTVAPKKPHESKRFYYCSIYFPPLHRRPHPSSTDQTVNRKIFTWPNLLFLNSHSPFPFPTPTPHFHSPLPRFSAKPQLLTKSKAQFISALRPDVDTADTLSLAPTVFAPAVEEPELDEDEEVKEAEEEAKEADPGVGSSVLFSFFFAGQGEAISQVIHCKSPLFPPHFPLRKPTSTHF